MRILIIVLLILLSTALKSKSQNLPYTNQTEAGLLIGDGVNPSFSFQTFNGFKITKWKLEAGITSGVDIYRQITVIPVSAGLKWNPFNTRSVSPYASLDAGYGFDWLQRKRENQQYEGGFMVNPSLGLRIKSIKATKLNLSLGFKQQRAVIYPSTYLYDFVGGRPDIENKEKYTFRRVSLSFGLSF